MSSTSHSYYEWQLSTLMLAYDAVEPLGRHDDAALVEREQNVRKELFDLVDATLPQSYKDNPEQDFPPELVTLLTRATLKRAAEILRL